MPTRPTCRREIEGLHAFFVDWYDGVVDRGAFARMERAIGPDFVMVTPAGTVLDRQAVLGMVREGYGRTAGEGFDIEIRDVEVVHAGDETTLARYEEWQSTGEEREEGEERDEEGRLSTALFRADADAPEGVEWLSLHETAIED